MDTSSPSRHLRSRRHCLRGFAGLVLTGLGLLAGCGSSVASSTSHQSSLATPVLPPASPATPPASPTSPPPTPDRRIPIGLLAPLQGASERFGAAARYGAQRGIARAGGQRLYRLVIEDDSTPTDGGVAARKLLEQDKVVVAMIAIGSPRPSTLARVFQEAEAPVVGWSCMRDLHDFSGPSSFVVFPRERFEVFCPEQPSTGGAAVYAEDTMLWIVRAVAAADTLMTGAPDPRAIRDALIRLPYR